MIKVLHPLLFFYIIKNLDFYVSFPNSINKFKKSLGLVEHDANEIINNIFFLVRKIKKKIKFEKNLFLSITNQRETFVIFDKISGKPLHNAIVWQCRRGQKVCDKINKSKK